METEKADIPLGGMDMEAVVLIGSVVFVIVVGYFAIDRLDRFLNEVGIFPEQEEADSVKTDVPKQQNCCGTFHGNVL